MTEERTWSYERDQAYIQQFGVFTDLIAGCTVAPQRYADAYDAVKTLAVARAALSSAEELRFVSPNFAADA